jgi:hypothetical protein
MKLSQFILVTSLKSSVNPITNPNPVSIHLTGGNIEIGAVDKQFHLCTQLILEEKVLDKKLYKFCKIT